MASVSSSRSDEFQVRPASWRADEKAIALLRRRVFIDEQGVPENLEWEAVDPDCQWFVAESCDAVIGIVRLLPNGHIGRMAVIPIWRRLGVGSALLEAALVAARAAGFKRAELSAQTQAIAFYKRAGFNQTGEEFMDAGIPHCAMYKDLK